LKLKYAEQFSFFSFKFNLRRYIQVVSALLELAADVNQAGADPRPLFSST
jgi:hypothetical protein